MTTVPADLIDLYADSDALCLAELVRRKEVAPVELTEVAISLIEQLDPKLNAVVIRAFDRARARAAEAPGEGMFAGVPYLLKNIGSACKGLPLTNSLEYLKDYVSPSDSEMVRRIKASGLNILGRTNLPELGWCIATEPCFCPRQSPRRRPGLSRAMRDSLLCQLQGERGALEARLAPANICDSRVHPAPAVERAVGKRY
jgi:Asp-tRNA(Asn)/Glu-tRNA(Gln) amidotransferase A subunit family amidase